MLRHNDVIGRNEYLILHGQNLPFLRYIHCNFCLNLHIIHGDMKENVSWVFFSEHSVAASYIAIPLQRNDYESCDRGMKTDRGRTESLADSYVECFRVDDECERAYG